MPNFFSRLIVLLCLALSFSAQAADNGLLWKVESPNGKVSHLLGTIHTDDERVTEFSPKIIKAIDQSDLFMMETLPPSDASFFMMKQGNVAQLLTQEELEQVFHLCMQHSMLPDYSLHMKPWLLAVVFDLPKSMSALSMDEKLMMTAIEKSKKIKGLEENAAHFSMLDSISIDDQMVMLRAVLKRTTEDKQRDFESLITTYKTGDLQKIGDLDETITGGMLPKELWGKMKTKLIDERNQGMADGLIAAASESKVFAAIGAAHLGGENGLLARLRGAGFKVSAVKIN